MAQKFYDKALTIGLKGYAQLHQTVISHLADWEGIEKSRSVRDFDNYATRVLGKYETVDAYYRHNSSTNFVGNVMVPLLCISALDDPVCTIEAIPWDECRRIRHCFMVHDLSEVAQNSHVLAVWPKWTELKIFMLLVSCTQMHPHGFWVFPCRPLH